MNTTDGAYVYCLIDDVSLIHSCDLDINESRKEISITIYPNPITDNLTFTTSDNLPYHVSLFDITSRKVLDRKFINSISLDTRELSKGIYFYEVENNNKIIRTGTVIKQ